MLRVVIIASVIPFLNRQAYLTISSLDPAIRRGGRINSRSALLPRLAAGFRL